MSTEQSTVAIAPNPAKSLPDPKTSNLIATVSGILGGASWYVSTVKEYSEKLGIQKPAVAAVVGSVLLIVAVVMKWDAISPVLDRLRGVVSHHISGFVLLLSVCILSANGILLVRVLSLSESTSELAHYASTRFVGVFPDSLPTITQLINSANQSVEVLTDHVAFGAFSAPEDFAQYRIALTSAATRASVTVIAFSANVREAALQAQFKSTQPLEKSFFDPESPRWVKFHRFNSNTMVPTDWAGFLGLVKQLNDDVAKVLSGSGVTVHKTEEEAPILMWIVDRKIAAFSFHNREGKEIAIATSDPQILAMLNETFMYYKDSAKDYP